MAATAAPLMLPALLRGDADGAAYPILPPRNADSAGGLLAVERDLSGVDGAALKATWDARLGSRAFPYRSGVWRYREMIAPFPDDAIVSAPEGNTNRYCGEGETRCAGCRAGGCRAAGANARGREPDRLLQGSGNDRRHLPCPLRGRDDGRLRVQW
jgi:hypothetical protein